VIHAAQRLGVREEGPERKAPPGAGGAIIMLEQTCAVAPALLIWRKKPRCTRSSSCSAQRGAATAYLERRARYYIFRVPAPDRYYVVAGPFHDHALAWRLARGLKLTEELDEQPTRYVAGELLAHMQGVPP
jgi:hypothetical protein